MSASEPGMAESTRMARFAAGGHSSGGWRPSPTRASAGGGEPGGKRSILSLFFAAALGIFGSEAALCQRVPVVVIPGILGSELVDGDGNKVWGPLVASLRNFSRLEFPRDPDTDRITATGLVESVQLLGPIQIDKYGGLISTLEGLGYVRDRDLFTFPYDWRQSNFRSAQDLRDFVRSRPELSGEFWIVSHSMGGVITRIFVHQYPEGKQVSRWVTLGTPHLGSFASLKPLMEGLGPIQNLLAGGEDAVRKVAFSLPSLWELLPWYEGCCLQARQPGRFRSIDLLDDEVWSKFSWLPEFARSAEAVSRRSEGLAGARRIRDLTLSPLPSGVRMIPVAGTLLATAFQAHISEDGKTITWGEQGNGDGTVVTRSAASADRFNARVAIRKHSTIFEDVHVRQQLSWLLSQSGVIPFSSVAVSTSARLSTGDWVELQRVEMWIEPPIVRRGEKAVVVLKAIGNDGSRVEAVSGRIEVLCEAEVDGPPSRGALGELRLEFRPRNEGVCRATATIDGVDGGFDDYVLVVEAL